MCIPTPPHQQMSDSDITPDGNEPLLIKKTKPSAPPGYMARFIEGQWRIVPDPNQWGQGTGHGLGLGAPQAGGSTGGGGGGGTGQGSGK